MVLCSAAVEKNEHHVNLEKFSKLTLIFRFVNRLKHSDSDPGYVAKVYLIKWAQRQHYGHEIEFLENPSRKGPPELVQNLNLFGDQSGIVQSRTRTDKTTESPFEFKYPILPPKYSALTKLIVQECHNDCKHRVLQRHCVNWDCLDIVFTALNSLSNIILLIVLYAENTMHCPLDILDWPTCLTIQWIWLDLFYIQVWFHLLIQTGEGEIKRYTY